MSTTRRSSTGGALRSAPKAQAAKPRGKIPPIADYVLFAVRSIAIVITVLGIFRPQLTDLVLHADLTPPTPQVQVDSQHPASSAAEFPLKFRLPQPEEFALGLLQELYRQAWYAYTTKIVALVTCTVFLVELLLILQTCLVQARRVRSTPTTYLRVRTTAPAVTVTTRAIGASVSTSGDQFFRAIHLSGIPYSRRGRVNGSAPWAAFVLTGVPDEPVELGVVVAHHDERKRAAMEMGIRTTIQGQAPGAKIERFADPLAAVIAPGVVVGTEEYALAQPSEYPLRFLEDIEGSDLLGPTLAGVMPHGTLRTELQVIVRPEQQWKLDVSWRGRARRLQLRLADNEDHALSDDVKTVETKLDAAPYETFVRVVVVADGPDAKERVEQALDEIATPLGAYAERTGSKQQALKRVGRTIVIVPTEEQAAAGADGWNARAFRWFLRRVSGSPFGRSQKRVARDLEPPPLPEGFALIVPTATSAPPPSVLACAKEPMRKEVALLAKLLARAPGYTPPMQLVLPVPWRSLPSSLTSIEIAGLWHLPTPILSRLVRWLDCMFLSADPHAFIKPGDLERIIVGIAQRADGTLAPIGPTLRDLRQILHLTAGMGTGKSRLLAVICKQLIRFGFILLDGKGDDRAGNLTMTMRRHIPLKDEGRLIILDVMDTDWPFGLNPMAGIDLKAPGGADQGLAQLLSIFARIDPETWGKSPGMHQYAKMGALLVLETEKHPTFAHVKQALQDDDYRARLLETCRNQEVLTFWTITYPNTAEQQKTSRDALLRRFDALLVTETTRYMVSQPNPTMDLLEAMENGTIVLVPMPEMMLGDLAGTIGMIVFQAVVRAALGRGGDDQSRNTYAMVIDEFQVFVGTGDSKDVRKALTQLRSLGIAGIYAHQGLKQLGELVDEMLTNAASRIILKTQEPDASAYAKQYSPYGITAADISGQNPNEHQYAVLQCDGRPTRLLSMQTLQWPAVEEVVVPEETDPVILDWKKVIPADTDSPSYDRRLAEIVHTKYVGDEWTKMVAKLASSDAGQWERFLARWAAIRETQRAHILAHPGCIPDRFERQQWLSRLLAATPRVIAAAEYARIRRTIEPAAEEGGKQQQGAGKQQQGGQQQGGGSGSGQQQGGTGTEGDGSQTTARAEHDTPRGRPEPPVTPLEDAPGDDTDEHGTIKRK